MWSIKRLFFVILLGISLLVTPSVYAAGPGYGPPPPPPDKTNGIPPPGAALPIDSDLSYLFVAGILLASYVLYKKRVSSVFKKSYTT